MLFGNNSIDESGTGLKDKNSDFFILGCVAFDAKNWSDVDRGVNNLKRKLIGWAKPEDWEIKGRDIRRGEKFFKPLKWEQRVACLWEIGEMIAGLPCQLITVQIDKRAVTEYIDSESLYRLAFWRMLEEIDQLLVSRQEIGMLMIDMRSDMHSSVQDRRLLDAYHDWVTNKQSHARIIEMPWFGFSSFYAGLQLADFVSYLTDFVTNEKSGQPRDEQIIRIFNLLMKQMISIRLP